VKVQTVHAADKIRQVFYEVRENERLHAVSLLLNHFRPESTLAFCNTKQQCRELLAVLQAQGFDALALYGELEQRERDQVLVQFANRSCSVLVATDVAARGLDINQLNAVINVDVTPDAELHIHRIGRTGRADAQGLALTLVSLDEMGAVGRIEVLQSQESQWAKLSGLSPAAGDKLQAPMVREDERLHAVSLLLNHFRPESTLAFCNTKQQCRELLAVLQAQGFDALALYGELEQRERDQVLVQFANRSCSVLVATDVAARGLDISQLNAVINVDVTPDAELHIHRIGRTGRADAQGLALTLASLDEMGAVGRIEVLQDQESQWAKLSELSPAAGDKLQAPMRTLQIVGGRKEKIRAGDVLGAMTGEAGFSADQIGKINVNEFSTYVAVDRAIAQAAVERLSKGRIKGKSVRVRLLTEESIQR